MPNFRQLALSSALTLALITSLAGCGHELTPEEHIAKAKVLIEKGEIRSASIELANAVEKNPKSVDGRWLRAKISLDIGDGATAEKEIRKAIELGFSKSEAQPLLAQAILQQGDLDRTLKETEKIHGLPTAKNKAMILALRGQALVMKDKYDAAKTVLTEALQVDPNSSAALIGMTAMHAIKREFVEAQRWADMAIKAEPTSPDAWSAQGELQLAQSNLPKAEMAFSNAIKYRNFSTLDTAKRALVRVQLKKLSDAEKDIEAMNKGGFGKHPYVSYVAGRIFFAQKKVPQAAEQFEASYTAAPDNQLNKLYLATCYHQLGQQEKALALANKLSAESPQSLYVKRLLAGIQISRSEYDAAKEILLGALTSSPNDVGALNMLTSTALMQGDKAKGLEYASRLVSLAPNSSEAKNQLMMAKLLAGQPLGATSTVGASDPYTVEYLLAVDSLRNKQPTKVLELTKELQTRYPGKVELSNLTAAAYLMLGQWDKAKPELEKVLKLKPGDPSATRNLAKIETIKGNPKRARELLQALVKVYPGSEESVLLLADIEARLGNSASKIQLLEQLVQRNHLALIARTNLAAEYLRTGKYAKVVELTQGLSEAQLKQHPALLELRGKALIQSGDVVSTRKTFEQWTKLAPDSAPAHFYYGDILARAGNGPASRQELNKALKLNPRYLPARVGEIKGLVQANNLKQAQQALAKLKQDFGERNEVLGIEGWFALGMGNFVEAEKYLAAAQKKSPDSELAILLVRAQWGLKKHELALNVMRDWVKTHPDDLVMRLQLAGAYLNLNRNEDARAAYAQVVERYPNHVPALNNLAWLGQDKDLNQSIKHAQHALTIAPKDPYVKDTLGMLMLKQGDTTGAQKLLREAAELAPANTQIQFHYAQILVKQQRNAEAQKALQALLKKAPQAPQAKEAKALLDSLNTNKP